MCTDRLATGQCRASQQSGELCIAKSSTRHTYLRSRVSQHVDMDRLCMHCLLVQANMVFKSFFPCRALIGLPTPHPSISSVNMLTWIVCASTAYSASAAWRKWYLRASFHAERPSAFILQYRQRSKSENHSAWRSSTWATFVPCGDRSGSSLRRDPSYFKLSVTRSAL